ncbi:methyltransferase [Brachybacterium sp. GPGPB12]|uniref:methyltransferase n=1 Tax=Brachybacterium sp. GPGPB12 TaxID=3023517 RepID=UPI00313444C4
MRVLGSDDDADAVASTRATLAATGLDREGVEVTWDVSLSRCEEASADLVPLNPPFHDGTVVDATLVQGLLDAAARVPRPGGRCGSCTTPTCATGPSSRPASVPSASAPATAASRC